MDEVEKTFKIFDKDGSEEIDREEALKHWKSSFGKLSAKEFFNQVDFDGDGQISLDEFKKFWRIAKGHGVTEEEIMEELTNIQNGETWVGFDKMPAQKKPLNKND